MSEQVAKATVNAIFLRRALSGDPERVGYYRKEGERWVPHSWAEVYREVAEIAAGLAELGVGKGDRVAIMASTRPEWTGCDLGILGLGAITVGIYPTLLPEQVRYLVEHSGTRLLILEDRALAERVWAAVADLPSLERLVMIDPEGAPAGSVSLEELRGMGARRLERQPDFYLDSARAVEPEDVCSYIYTSGTTGPPKGAILTHSNFAFVVEAVGQVIALEPGDRSLVFLPLAHSLQRYATYYGLDQDVAGYYATSLETIPQELVEVRPTVLASVPRILEKIHTRAQATAQARGAAAKVIFQLAHRVGRAVSQYQQRGEAVPLHLRLPYLLAQRLVFSKIRAHLGGEVRWAISGGAPLAREISEFFHACGILVMEGYGLTETSAPATINSPEDYRFGTVGKPLPGVEIRIAADGEIMIRGGGVFSGYYRDPEQTAEVLDADGWFASGDIGHLDEGGYLVITDRKKDIIVTAGGKNIAPQNIENLLKGDRFISQALVHGDKRKFLSALITVDEEEVRDYARQAGFMAEEMAALIDHPEIKVLVEQAVARANAQLPRFEQIKRYQVLPVDFTQESGELTPTLKLKRRVIEERYREKLDDFYRE